MRDSHPNVLIVESSPVIAFDVAETVKEVLGDCTTRTVSTLDEAAEELTGDIRFGLAILCLSVKSIADAAFDALLDQRGLAVVVICDESDCAILSKARPGWGAVEIPFTTPRLVQAILHASENRGRGSAGTHVPVAC